MAGDEYRRHAADCVKSAESAGDAATKAELMNMAAAWLRLADQAEKNSHNDMVYETPDVAAPPKS
jgi:hypothetical protein